MANIRTSHKSGFITRNGVRRRQSLWLAIAAVDTTLGAAATAVITNLSPATILALRPFTIVRTRGELFVRSDQSAATEDFVVSMGYSVVTDQAIAIGVTAVPTPRTDQSSDQYFVYETVCGQFSLVGTSVVENFTSRTFDSKAMRKVEDGQDIAFVVEAGLIGFGAQVLTTARMLVKLH